MGNLYPYYPPSNLELFLDFLASPTGLVLTVLLLIFTVVLTVSWRDNA